MLATGVEANEPFYKGKRLNLMINFAAGGPADIEGRIFARHFARHIDGAPNIVIQNRDGAGGLVGTNYLGEVAPRDGTVAGYLTAAAWNYVIDPAAYRIDFGTFEFVAYQPANIVYFVRTDTPPGVKDGASLLQSDRRGRGRTCGRTPRRTSRSGSRSISSACRTNTSPGSAAPRRRGLRCSGARSTSFRSRRRAISASIEPTLVKTGQAMPVWYDPVYDGTTFAPFKPMVDQSGPELCRFLSQGERHGAVRAAVGRLSHQPRGRRRHAAHDGAAAGRAGWRRRCAARRDRAAQQRCGVRRRRR